MKGAIRSAFVALLLSGAGLGASAAGYLPLAAATQPLKDRLAEITEALPPLQARLRMPPLASDARETTRERALAWARVQVMLDEQRQLQVELADAQRAAEDPLRLH